MVIGMFSSNNVKFNEYYEAKLPKSHKLKPNADDQTRTAFIRSKYERKMFYGDPSEYALEGQETNDANENRSLTPRSLRRLQRRQERDAQSNSSATPIVNTNINVVPNFDVFSSEPVQSQAESVVSPSVTSTNNLFSSMSISTASTPATVSTPAKKPMFSNMTFATSSQKPAAPATSNITVTSSGKTIFNKPAAAFDINSIDFTTQSKPKQTSQSSATTSEFDFFAIDSQATKPTTTSNDFDIFNTASLPTTKQATVTSTRTPVVVPTLTAKPTVATPTMKPHQQSKPTNIFGGITIKTSAIATSNSKNNLQSPNCTPEAKDILNITSTTPASTSTPKPTQGNIVTQASGRKVFVKSSTNWLDSYTPATPTTTPVVSSTADTSITSDPFASMSNYSMTNNVTTTTTTLELEDTSGFDFLNGDSESDDESIASAFGFLGPDSSTKNESEDDVFSGLPGHSDLDEVVGKVLTIDDLSFIHQEEQQPAIEATTTTTAAAIAATTAIHEIEEPSAFGLLLDSSDNNTPASDIYSDMFATQSTSASLYEEEPSAFGLLLDDDTDTNITSAVTNVDASDEGLGAPFTYYNSDLTDDPFVNNDLLGDSDDGAQDNQLDDEPNATVLEENYDEESLWSGGLLDD